MSQGPALLGALWGGLLGLGLLIVVHRLPTTRRVDLADRIEPYLDRGPVPSRLVDRGRSPGAVDLAWGPALRRLGGLVDRTLGGTDSVRLRLARAGQGEDVEGFRVQQVLWGAAAALAVASLGSLLWWARGASLSALALVVASAAVGGVLLRDQWLTRQARRRQERILAEFPALAELLSLAVTAGEGAVQALDRVARLSSGELAQELQLALAHARTGATLPESLQAMARRAGSPPVTRFLDGLVVAIQRGTPLGEVLRAQAQDARESARSALIEEGGRREIAMMVPVVFLVLPVTVLFAVYPGVTMLRLAV